MKEFKIKINVQKLPKDSNNQEEKEENLENQVVAEIQKIKPVDTTIKENHSEQEDNTQENNNTKVNKADIQNIKKFLIEEYGVNEKCLAIN